MTDTTSFFDAIKAGDVETVRGEAKGNPSLFAARTESGESPLLLATYYGKDSVIQALLESGQQPDLFEASALGQVERARTLAGSAPESVNAVSDDGFTPLQLAAFFGHPEIVDLLLDNGADVQPASRNRMGVTALHAGLAGRSAEARHRIAKALIQHGAVLNAKQPGGFTPLHEAAQNGDSEVVRLLLEKGADSEAVTDEGKTALIFATEGRHSEAIAILQAIIGSTG